ncbi:CsiV family protein [Microbulbifer sp. MLAF003]|uniref:CsiV family protein n=1 Tax=Microbulbifer TaxID=48073 RepID=UPI0003A6B607|nr:MULTISPECIES: CsiV family protein [Microbulbifer]WHI53049.1 CsiV family protein [Microbulbifer sp. MLAF003]
MTVKRITRLCSTLALALAAAGTQAANYAGNTFEIEMIIFERPQGMAQTSENWPANPRLEYPSNWVDFETRQENPQPTPSPEAVSLTELAGEEVSTDEPLGFEPLETNGDKVESGSHSSLLLSPTATLLGNKATALARGGDRILFHKAWRQILKQKRNSPAILIDGGDTFQGHSQLGGSITLSVSRYLHISTDLWLNDFSTPASVDGVLLPQRPRVAVEAPLEIKSRAQSEENYKSVALQDVPNSLSDYEPVTLSEPQLETEHMVYAAHTARLQHERRLRSGQLHYIDHPAFGILIEVRTVAKPTEEDIKASNTIENNISNTGN